MSTIRDRRKHQNRVDAIAEALDLNHNTTTNAPHAFASAGVSSADNATNSEGLSDDHAHTQAKDDSTNQHLDLHQGADGQNFCSGCNEIKDIFDFERGIRVKSWRTLDLVARVDAVWETYSKLRAPKKVWKVTRHISKTCPFCSFLMGCASRMAIHTTVDLKSNDWFLALGARFLEYRTGEAGDGIGTSHENSRTPILELKLCQSGDTKNPFVCAKVDWENTHLILPVQACDDGNDEVSDTIDWELIKMWLNTCHSEHVSNCHTDPTPVALEEVPSFCLIDCETGTIIRASGIRNLKYVTLSYVWGASTTSPQVLDASTSLPVLPDSNQRPKVVNDAMEAVRRIGCRYLWVDRYCIPQSDHDAKSIQINKMGKIYSLSVLTIIAAAGNDAEYGLPGVSLPPTLQPVWTTIHSGKREMPVIYFEPPNKDISRSTWNSRAWTYQEALLSKRRLVFTDRHVYFQCESMQSVGTRSLYNHPDQPPFSAQEREVFPFQEHYGESWLESIWECFIWEVINNYTKRTLSFEQDAIHAVQGILQSLRDRCDLWFFYGLPIMNSSASDFGSSQNDSTVPNNRGPPVETFVEVDSGMQTLLASLLWRDSHWDTSVAADSTQETRLSGQAEQRRIKFPSWMWAGWKTARYTPKIEADRVDVDYSIPKGLTFEIRVSYDDQYLTWWRDNQEIRRRSENISEFPDFLIIRGPVFDVSISCTDLGGQPITSRPTGPIVWKYTSPRFLASKTYRGPPFSVKEVRGHAIDLVALCVVSAICERGFFLHMLILRSVGEDTHGQIYERLTCDTFLKHWSGPHLWIKDINLRQMELRIR